MASDDCRESNDGEGKHRLPGIYQEDTDSLTEFEEIERLIEANTAQESDGSLSDISIDLERKILIRRVSRESGKVISSEITPRNCNENEKSVVCHFSNLSGYQSSLEPESPAHELRFDANLPMSTHRSETSQSDASTVELLNKLYYVGDRHSHDEDSTDSNNEQQLNEPTGSFRFVSENKNNFDNSIQLNSSTPYHLLQDASGELTARSDLSISQLKSKLEDELELREREKEFSKQLKIEYDELLMKYAEAENTIDYLRLGAQINLSTIIPVPKLEKSAFSSVNVELSRSGKNLHEADANSQLHDNNVRPDQSESWRFATSDNLNESSLQLSFVATNQLLGITLEQQLHKLQDKLDAFELLLKDPIFSLPEQQQTMEIIKRSLYDLERAYLSAVDKHVAERQKRCKAAGGSVIENQSFDSDRKMEADIFSLGQRVRDFHHVILTRTQSSHESPVLSSAITKVSQEAFKSSKSNKSATHANGKGDTITSTPKVRSKPGNRHKLLKADHVVEDMLRGRLKSDAIRKDTPNFGRINKSAGFEDARKLAHPHARRPRHGSSTTSGFDESGTSSSPSPNRWSSKLPRPVNRLSHERCRLVAPQQEKRERRSSDKGADSGFVGSESSRHSATSFKAVKVKAVDVTQNVLQSNAKNSRSVSLEPNSTLSTDCRFQHNDSSHQDNTAIDSEKPPTSNNNPFQVMNTSSNFRKMPSRPSSTSPPPSVFTTDSIHRPRYTRGSTSGISLRSQDSGFKRSAASSSHGSSLKAIRGEIARLREEVQAVVKPVYTSTPRPPLLVEDVSEFITSENEALKAIRVDIKGLKKEVEKQSRTQENKSEAVGSRRPSVTSTNAVPSSLQSRDENKKSSCSNTLCNSKLVIGSANEASVTRRYSDFSATGRRKRRSRSQDRSRNKSEWWAYVEHPMPVGTVWAAAPVGRVYAHVSPIPSMIDHAPLLYNVPSVSHHATPVIGPSLRSFTPVPIQATSARIYVRTPHQHCSTPSKPDASVYMAPQRRPISKQRVREANVYIVESDEKQPIRRNHHQTKLRGSSTLSQLKKDSAFTSLHN